MTTAYEHDRLLEIGSAKARLGVPLAPGLPLVAKAGARDATIPDIYGSHRVIPQLGHDVVILLNCLREAHQGLLVSLERGLHLV